MTAPRFVDIMFLLNCFATSFPSKSDRVSVDTIGPSNPVPRPRTALPTRTCAMPVAKYGMNPPMVVIISPSRAIALNLIFFPTTSPDMIVNGTAVRLDNVAIEAMASEEASGKLPAMVDSAGDVALEASVMKLIAHKAIIESIFLFFIFPSHGI